MGTDDRDVDAPPPVRFGLSARVLLLTIAFVTLGEVLIFLPSIADFRIQWLRGRVAQAEIAALAAEAAPSQLLSSDLRSEILKGAGVRVVSLQRGGTRKLVLRSDDEGMVEASYDLRAYGRLAALADAFGTLLHGSPRVISVIDKPPNMSGELIEIALDEKPLAQAMLAYVVNALVISLALSLLVAALMFAALNRVLVRPMRGFTRQLVAFGANPEDASRIVTPSGRRDEIGVAEHELGHMQRDLAALLQHKSRLASLGLAVAKVSHEMRNMLSSAHLISDRLTLSDDPTVKRFAPKLIASLDRAIHYLDQTLQYGKAHEPPPVRQVFALRALADEVIDAALLQASPQVLFFNHVAKDIQADADREQLARVLGNLMRNASEALEQAAAAEPQRADGTITLRAWREGSVVLIEVADTGPGIPEKVRPKLFEAFQSAAKAGGTGLGLAIAAELMRAHGGTIDLGDSGAAGTRFVLTLPDRVAELKAGKRGTRALDRSAG